MAHCKGRDAQAACIECEVPQLARNNFFTGKLLVERDFKDEQRFFIGKDRRHNQTLHGWGTVCGLKVGPHPNASCQGQYVIVEPGTAVDCCGREIVVGRKEIVDLRALVEDYWRQRYGKEAEPDAKPHTLQICLRYRECETEDVPAAFDECGCDETACMPNRVQESYEFGVRVDEPLPVFDPASGVGVRADGEYKVAGATHAAFHDATERLYVSKATDPAAVTAVSTFDGQTLATQSFANYRASGLAVSADGTRVYVALHKGGSADGEIRVFDAANISGAPKATVTVAGAGNDNISLAAAPDGRLYAVHSNENNTYVWADDINTSPTPAAPTKVAVDQAPADIAVGRDGTYVYVANSNSENVSAIRTGDLSVSPVHVGAGVKPVAVSVAASAKGDNLVVIDASGSVSLFAFRPDEPNPADRAKPLGDPVKTLLFKPLRTVASPRGRWVYALEINNGDKQGHLQVIDVERVAAKKPGAVGEDFALGAGASDVLLTPDGRHLYVSLPGDGTVANPGLVRIVDLFERVCGDIFKSALEDCPSCTPHGECLVLATVRNYVYKNKFVDTPPQAGESRIDNVTGRQLLPSTSLITEVVECILEDKEKGQKGDKGDKGDPGKDGKGVKSVDAETVDPPATADATYDPATEHIHFKIPRGPKGADGASGKDGVSVKSADAETIAAGLPAEAAFNAATGNVHFKIPKGDKGDAGKDGNIVLLDFPRIVAINWPHNGDFRDPAELSRIDRDGLIVAFSKPVFAETLHKQSIELLIRMPRQQQEVNLEIYCYCNVNVLVTGVKVEADCESLSKIGDKDVTSGPVNGARIRPVRADGQTQTKLDFVPGDYRVLVKGDFIVGAEQIEFPDGKKRHPALDANHIGPAIQASPNAPVGVPPRCPSGNMAEGDTFESWFNIPPPGTFKLGRAKG